MKEKILCGQETPLENYFSIYPNLPHPYMNDILYACIKNDPKLGGMGIEVVFPTPEDYKVGKDSRVRVVIPTTQPIDMPYFFSILLGVLSS